MQPVFRPTREEELDAVGALLRETLSLATDDPVIHRDHLRWKYTRPRQDVREPRSFVIDRGGALQAHIGLWPLMPVHSNGNAMRMAHFIDWGANQSSVGAGVALLKNACSQLDAAIVVGGSDMARRILPVFGFQPRGIVRDFRRPIRPWRQLAAYRHWNWKTPLWLAREFWRMGTAGSVSTQGFIAERAGREAWGHIEALSQAPASEGFIGFRRTAGLLETMQDCPVADFAAYLIRHQGNMVGYFILSLVSGQARIVDARRCPDSELAWSTLYQLAWIEAGRWEEAFEVITTSSNPHAWEGLWAAGFRKTRDRTLMMYRRGGLPSDDTPVDFQMLDSDSAYLNS